MRWIKRTGVLLFGLVVLAGLFVAWHFHSNVEVTTSEVFRQDEDMQAERASENFIEVIKQTMTSHASRGAHAKGHACVKAWFKVRADLEPELRHGIFSQPGRAYKSWIRFSNGSSNLAKSDDRSKDSRGMAIKLINIENQQSKTASGHAQVQDFLMHNNPVFFSANIDDYNRLVESENKILSFLDDPNPFKWRLRELKHVIDTLAEPPQSPLQDEYFSNTAYKFGPHNIKFSAQPCNLKPPVGKGQNSDPDFLRKNMAIELEDTEACFYFMVQLQLAGKYMPIEDPSIQWKEKDSAWRTLAQISIPIQHFEMPERQQFCEDLSFNPWHSLDAHRPIGQLNRIRKLVYAASSRFRHQQNGTEEPANLQW